VVAALAVQLKSDVGLDVSARAVDLKLRLAHLSVDAQSILSVVPAAQRKLVTGHESLGYFADRYGFKLVGAVVPGLSDQAETTSADLAALEGKIRAEGVSAIFTELGTSPATSQAIARDTGARVVELSTHVLPADGSYFTFIRSLAGTIGDALSGPGSVSVGPAPAPRSTLMSFGPLVDPFTQNDLMLRALIAGILVSIACAVVGTFVVLRGLAFIGDALAHGVLPGVAVAMLVGAPGMLGAAVGAVVMIGGVTVVTQRSKLSSDSAIGLLFVGMLALGVVIVSHSASFSGDLTRILFGEILGVSPQDLVVQAVATLAVVAASFLFYRPFLLLCFDPEQAQVSGFSARRYHALMLLLVAMTVVVSFTSVGTLLVFGMLLAPAATGALLTSRLRTMMMTAVIVGAVSTYLGLLISYNFDTAAGATIVLVATFIFFSVLTAANVRAGLRQRPSSAAWGHE
jgi:ABC-type Mn2+/Zn2+ transport system permease subunit